MTSRPQEEARTLFESARAAGVAFARETSPADGSVHVNGLRFHYLDWGNPADPPVLLLHGFAQTGHSWDFAALSLCDRFRVVALDQRGHGDSDWAADGDYALEAQQGDLHGIVEALGLRDFVLMGLSMGGRNAFTYAARHPDRVRALVIVDAAPETQRSGTGNIRRFVESDDVLDSVEDFVQRVRRYNSRRPLSQVRGGIIHNIRQLPDGRWTWKYDKALRSPGRGAIPDPDLTKRLWSHVESLRCPTLVVRGAESDVVSAETARGLAARVPGASLVVVENAGHLVIGDNPAGFERAIRPFLSGLGPWRGAR